MIIKGGSRGGPKWLGRHLTRTDTNERVEVMELQSPHADLTEAFRDWQVIAAGTRGYKGLYHANIDPAMDYVMTPEQWWRSVELLERELGLDGQPRAVVLHEKHGRQHLHVVWSRTDLDTMTLRSDSYNYVAHERASLALEREFGHAHVPGKHAKRDRERQPEPPKAALTHAEWQQAERSGRDPRVIREEIARLFHQSDTAQAFHAALQDAGYLLAKGDSRDFMIVDAAGGLHPLGRAVAGLTAPAQRAFIDKALSKALPRVSEARAEQETRAASVRSEERPREETAPEIEALRDAWRAHHRNEIRQLGEFHDAEQARTAEILNAEIAARLVEIDALHAAALDRHDREAGARRLPQPVERLVAYLNPARAEGQARLREESRAAVSADLAREREAQKLRLEAARDTELADLTERQAQQLREKDASFEQDLARRLSDEEEIQRRLAALEDARRAAQDQPIQGPDPPEHTR